MSIIDTLITDRTQSDVFALQQLLSVDSFYWTAAQKNAFLAGMKGAYNETDLNRVEGAVSYLCGLLQDWPTERDAYAAARNVAIDDIFAVPYDPNDYDLETKTTWQEGDYLSPSDLERYLSNVETLTTALVAAYPTLPDSMDNIDEIDANHIEKALLLLYQALVAEKERVKGLIDNAESSFVHCGQPHCGVVWAQIT